MAKVSPKFSDQLEQWLKGKQAKTLANLVELFGEKSFAVLIMLFMFIPALPAPTGGITHVFLEPVTALLAIEMIVGLNRLWIPDFLGKRIKVGRLMRGKLLRLLLRRLRWFEHHSRPRFGWVFRVPLFEQITGLLILAFTAAAFFAPPFSGLDTLPSLGVVIICLSIILDDASFYIAGVIIGALGVALSLALGEVIIRLIHHIL